MQKPTAPIKIVFFDIDETLYYKKETRIPLSISEQVLPRLRAKGIILRLPRAELTGLFLKQSSR